MALPTPSYVYTEEIGYRETIHSMEDGGEVRNSYGVAKRSFTLDYDRVTLAQRNAIITEYDTYLGRRDSFSWVNPNDNVTYTVRFMQGSLSDTEIAYQQYEITLQLIEVV